MQFCDVKGRRCFLLVIGTVILLAGYLSPCSGREQSQLETDLARMRHFERPRSADLSELETRCLKLIPDHNTPAEKGKIYATTAYIYSDAGYTCTTDPRLAKTVAYAKKALEHPLDVLTACDMYAGWAGSVGVQSHEYENTRFAERRRDGLAICLKGLKLALDHGAPSTLQTVPPVPRLDIGRESPMYKQIMEEHRKQVVAAEKAIFENELYWRRWTLTRLLITFYSRAPYDIEEFKGEAQKVLVGKDQVVAGIAAEMEKAVAFDKLSHSHDPNDVPKR